MKRTHLAVGAVFGALLLSLAPCGRAKAADAQCTSTDQTTVDIKYSTEHVAICGKPVNGHSDIYAYLGIEYATAERWRPPTATPPSSEAGQHIEFGSMCWQPQQGSQPLKPPPNERCLYLNVWAPASAIKQGAKLLPVLEFIHGGAFKIGAGSDLDGTMLATKGAVVVTLNYRLGALGFLSANAQGSGDIRGNFGLLDQQAAMTWVHNYIKAFGGDPNNITLFGESAGAMSVGLHTFSMPSPKEPLFAKAIMESNPMGVHYKTVEEAREDTKLGSIVLSTGGNTFLQELCNAYKGTPNGSSSCQDDPSWLTKVTARQIMDVQNGTTGANEATKANNETLMANAEITARLQGLLAGGIDTQPLPWAPVLDKPLVVGQPYDGYAPSVIARKPLMFGVNRDEGALFTAGLFAAKPILMVALTPTVYKSIFLPLVFHGYDGVIARVPRYDTRNKRLRSYYNEAGAALANLMTDYVFTCGNLAAANAAAQQAKDTPVYGYIFTQAPFFDIYNLLGGDFDHGACEPVTKNACHANELPYVFNSLAMVTTDQYKPRRSDQSLANAMSDAWFAFAQDPSKLGWKNYRDSGRIVELNGDKLSTPLPSYDVDAKAHCTNIWLKQKPYAH